MINWANQAAEYSSNQPQDAFKKILEAYYQPKQLHEDLLKQQLTNALSQTKLPYAGPEAEADLGLKQAQTKREEALANLPFGGHDLPGPAGQLLAVEAIGKMFGKDSPQYQQASQAFQLEQSKAKALMDYQVGLTNTLGPRYETAHGRALDEEARLKQGLSPTGAPWEQVANGQIGQKPLPISPQMIDKLKSLYQKLPGGTPEQSPLAPASPEELAGNYANARFKSSTDSATRAKINYAQNIEKTLERIDPDIWTQYAGAKGATKLLKEKALAPLGEESEDYRRYQKAVEDAGVLRGQIRQFYGDSIQPGAMAHIESLIDPATWRSNPKIAKEQFNELKEILKRETKTYVNAFKSPASYLSTQGSSSTESKGKKWVIKDGQLVEE